MCRRKKGLSLFLVIMLLFMTILGNTWLNVPAKASAASSKVWNGKSDISWYTGDLDYYELSTAEQLAGLAELVNAGNEMSGITFALTRDIVLNSTGNFSKWEKRAPKNQWISIGSKSHPFTGILDGQGHSIIGMYFKDTERHSNWFSSWYSNGGLFGYVSQATIVNLRIKNAFLNTPGTNGIIATYAENSFFFGDEVISSKIIGGDAGGMIGASAHDYTNLFMNYATYISMCMLGGGLYNPLIFGDQLMFKEDFSGTIVYACKVKGMRFVDTNTTGGICANGGQKDTGIGVKGCLVMNTSIQSDGKKGAIIGMTPSEDYAILMDCYKCNVKISKKSKNRALLDNRKAKSISFAALKKNGAKKLGKAYESVKGKEPRLKLFTATADKPADPSTYKLIEDGYYYISDGKYYLTFDSSRKAILSAEPQRYRFTYREGGFYTIENDQGESLLAIDNKPTVERKEYNPHRITQRWELVARGASYWIRVKGTEKAIVYYSAGPFTSARIPIEEPETFSGDVQLGYRSIWSIVPVGLV